MKRDLYEEIETEAIIPKKKKKKKNPLTSEEIKELQDAEATYSNLLRLQIKELLNEVCIPNNNDDIAKFVTHLKSYLLELKRGKQHKIVDQRWTKKLKVSVPVIQEPYAVPGNFRFLPPISVTVIGSYPIGTLNKPRTTIDLCLKIPQEFFTDKDYLNQRYFRKKALYMAFLAAKLRKHEDIEEVLYTHHHCNVYKPLLLVKPSGKLGAEFMFHVHVSPEEDTFKLNRFHINKNNVRGRWFNGKTNGSSIEECPTPVYNTSLLSDLLLLPHYKYVKESLTGKANLVEAISLLKVWLRQRQLDLGYGGFTGHMLTMLVIYLFQKGTLQPSMSTYLVMYNTLSYISSSNWNHEGITLNSDNDENVPDIEDFHQQCDVVFVDSSGYCNLCVHMSQYTYLHLKHEADLAIHILGNNKSDSFDLLFLQTVDYLHKFDQIIRIKRSLLDEEVIAKYRGTYQDVGGNKDIVLQKAIMSTLEKALGKRLNLAVVIPNEAAPFSIEKDQEDIVQNVSIGILLNPDHAFSVVEKGPMADVPTETKQFRDFWGEKSELRRFKDGLICEAVVWPCTTFANKRKVIQMIVRYILHRHIHIPENNIHVTGTDLDFLLKVPQLKKKDVFQGTGEEAMYKCVTVYEELCKQLRGVDNLPLNINTIQGTSPVFRHTEVFPPLHTVTNEYTKIPPWAPSQIVMCTLEGSGEWPDDLEAIRRLKAAFYIKLSNLLQEQFSLKSKLHPSYLDVAKGGYVFRIILISTRELSIIQQPANKNVPKFKLLAKDFIHLPKLSTALNGINVQNSSFSSVVRIIKRWLCSQLFGDIIDEVVVELICAGVFLSPHPYQVPRSVISGFMRFLHLLATHQWKKTPLIVNFNEELSKGDMNAICDTYKDKHPMCIITPYDSTGVIWTASLTEDMVQRISDVAKTTHATLQQLLTSDTTQGYKVLFQPQYDKFDVFIHLDPISLSRAYEAVDVAKEAAFPIRAAEDTESTVFPLSDFDPVAYYLMELRACYRDLASFHHETYGGSIVAVKWKETAFTQHPFKMSNLGSREPVTNDTDGVMIMKVSKASILEHFEYLGKGLVKEVKVLNH